MLFQKLRLKSVLGENGERLQVEVLPKAISFLYQIGEFNKFYMRKMTMYSSSMFRKRGFLLSHLVNILVCGLDHPFHRSAASTPLALWVPHELQADQLQSAHRLSVFQGVFALY